MLHAKYKIRLIITRLWCLLVVLQVAFGSTCLFNSDCIQGYCKPDTLLCYNKSTQRSDCFFWMLESEHYLSKRLTDHHAPSIQIACRIFAVPTDPIPVTLQVQLFELMKAPLSHANLKKKIIISSTSINSMPVQLRLLVSLLQTRFGHMLFQKLVAKYLLSLTNSLFIFIFFWRRHRRLM
jgi:hypothetical protein